MRRLCVASVLAWAILAAGLVREPSAKAGAEAYEKSRWALACTFVVGFGSLNASFSLMPASLAMTLRAAEPLFSASAGGCRPRSFSRGPPLRP